MSHYTKTTAMAVSLTALYAFATPATALCTAGGDTANPTLICTGTDSAINDGQDNLAVTVESGAAISDTGDTVTLTGPDQTLDNLGLIDSETGNGILGTGANLTVTNNGTIEAGDRAIRLQEGADGFTLFNGTGGEIRSTNQAVRLDNSDALKNATITNDGLIESTDGRAIQSRGPGTTITNSGTLSGGEEVVEAREAFTLTNTGTIAIRGLSWDADTQSWTNDAAPDDEDGVQFASGTLENSGVILGTDDGVDLDEGRIINTGVIVSTGSASDPDIGGSGIDVDALFEPTVGPDRQAGALTIENAGYIEGINAIGTDPGSDADPSSTSKLTILNSGTLVGRSGTAIQMVPTQGDSSLTLSGDSEIFGDVIFGGGNDLLSVGDVSSGKLINSVFDGGAGENTVAFTELALGDVTSARFGADQISLSLATDDGTISGDFRNFGFWQFGSDEAVTTSAFRDALPQAVVVPVPAGLPLLITALGGLAWLRRRVARG
ncbi:VPLPA-CTERM sorting domain-containing protein [Roseovarius tibetensis]|uniref:VPLPA-CTERM sorting domain-containing protein n=1 Tax=Roseovarius tibetensis TaxID=2685897 RepID=UPI003D7F8309